MACIGTNSAVPSRDGKMSKKILLIGAGPTSALIAFNLKRMTKNLNCPLEVHLWEKSRGTGGRFSTSRGPGNTNCIADLGAQYLTHVKTKSWSQLYFDRLLENGIIRKFSPEKIEGFRARAGEEDRDDYICVQGTASVVKYFLQNSDVKNVAFNQRVAEISIEGDKVQIVEEGDSTVHSFDAVISTMPVPQILQLRNIDAVLSETDPVIKKNLEAVTYTSRYALGLFFDEKLELAPGEGPANFCFGDPIVRYWTVEDAKRRMGNGSDTSSMEASAVVIHTTVQFGRDNVDGNTDEIKEIILKHIEGKFKTLQGHKPQSVKCQKWRYSQVENGYVGSPGFVELSKTPLIIAAGDGFAESGFEGCILSADKATEHLISTLQ